ncbi:MAG: DUF5916 domain-containing protein [Rhodothermales bacterium]
MTYHAPTRLLRAPALCLVAFLFASTAMAQPLAAVPEGVVDEGTAFTPNIEPSLHIPRLTGEIHIDGELEEAGWISAARAVNFAETFPGDQTEPPIDVTVYLTYDEENLYVAYVIKDDPAAIRANMSDRDQIWFDDYSGMLLDTNGDGQKVYFIAANPLGIQGDTRSSFGNEDVSFNMVYQSEGRVTDTGYQIEMAIPFRSLRFPKAEVQTWRATFWITHPRDSRNTYSWAAINRDNPCFTCQFGTLDGMTGVTSGRNLEILPSITGAQSGALGISGDPDSGFDNGRVDVEPSLNVKYGITSDLTADMTINPDFSQIEADVAQVDVNSTFALFFPERRPFFQEGSDLFRTPIQTVYTRSINDPIVANKLTGRFGGTNVAYIGARDNTSPLMLPFEESSRLVSAGKSFSNIARVQHNFPDNSYLGALITDRRLDGGGSGTTLGIDGAVRFWNNYRIEGQVVASRTAEPKDAGLSEGFGDLLFDGGQRTAALDGESFWGHALYASLEREGRYWNFDFDYWETSPTFRADNGFVRQNDNRRFFMWQGVTLYPENISFIDRIQPNIAVGRTWNFDGVQKSDFISPGLTLRMKRQTNVNVRYTFERERFGEVDFDGLRSFNLNVHSNFSEPVQLGFSLGLGRDIARTVGTPELGNSLNVNLFGTLRPTQRLVVQPLFVYSELTDRETGEEFFSGYIARARVNYQFTRRFFMRTVVQYNDFAERLEVDPLITYKINAFTAFHFGSTHDFDTFDGRMEGAARFLRQSRRQFFFKFQYLLRR